jgi:hypothetical protein
MAISVKRSSEHAALLLRQQVFQRAAVDILQRIDKAQFDMLIDLVDAGVGRPNSITCGQICAIKRPSEVPPVVDSSVSTPVST